MVQLYALAVVVALTGFTIAAYRAWGWRARRASSGAALPAREKPYVLYFTGPDCTICKTHQEPALQRLTGVEVDKVDAIERADLAEMLHVYTVPTTVVVGTDGKPLAVNYGYAPAEKLRRQLDEAVQLRPATLAG
ncbi:MAG TPA: thioredoxin domain-containing protein [Candidatus Dormibacteraeota bacterium]